ncbi:uncharacterized protein LOC110685579 [Chenopodium quinoa]|uniref:uncharacterized protein LOC110685579 n=1 Tax=Chenopodium quinoa TaxID=63459 RepID=UPI000B7872B4|nr:uncharacterized protein LOC110685579 [Chenopodium quinoa]
MNFKEKHEEGYFTQRPPMFNGKFYAYWKNRMEIFIKAENYQVWRVIETGDFEITQTNDKHEARKILRSLPQDERWRSKVTAMQEAKDFTKFNMEQLAGSLMTHELHLSSNTESFRSKSLALKAQNSEESEVDEEEMAMLVRRFKKMMNNRKFDRNKKYTSSRNTTCFKCGSKDHFIKDRPVQDGEKGKTKGKEQSKDSRVYKPYFTKDNVKKAMLAAWGDTDSEEEEEDQPSEETAHLCLMAKTDEAAKLKELESELWFSYNQLKHLSKENLINTVLEIQEDLKELHRSKQISDKALVTYKENSEWVDNMKFDIQYSGKIGRSRSHAIDNVFLLEGLKHNLLSISQFCDKGNYVSFTSNKCRIIHNDTGNIILEGTRKGNTYVVDLNEVPKSSLTCLSVIEDDPLLWHRRFGHASFSLLDKLRSKNLVEGLPCIKFLYDKVCEACAKGKQTRISFKSKKMKEQRRTGNHLIDLRSDHGTEFENSKFDELCTEYGMDHNFSAPRTPQQNGVVERKNRSLEDMARTMLISSRLPRNFWAEAVNTACYILNRVSVRAITNKTPYELMKGKKPNISYFRSFGCKCFVHNNGKRNLGKFDERSDEADCDDDFEIGLVRTQNPDEEPASLQKQQVEIAEVTNPEANAEPELENAPGTPLREQIENHNEGQNMETP